MTFNRNMHRSGLTAIAAVLALSSTPAFAQDALAPEPVAESTTPVAEPATPVTTTTTTETTTEVASDPLAPEAATTATAPAATRRTTTRRTTTVARPAPAATAAAASVIAAAPMVEPTAPIAAAPIVPTVAEVTPVAAPPVEDASIMASDDLLPIAGAAGLGLLALLGAGAAMRRRKRREADEYATVDHVEPAFVAAPVRAEPVQPRAPRRLEPELTSAFNWNAPPAAAAATAGSLPEGIDGTKLGHHVEAAYRGPSADNPSLSLKTRIKRAAFFDQRERLVAKGKAVAVAPGAGLPTALAKQASRVRDAVTSRAPRPMASFQPA